MKSIAWKQVLSDPDTSQKFAIEVYNRFQLLATEEINSENVNNVYQDLVKTTEEVALETLPRKNLIMKGNQITPRT